MHAESLWIVNQGKLLDVLTIVLERAELGQIEVFSLLGKVIFSLENVWVDEFSKNRHKTTSVEVICYSSSVIYLAYNKAKSVPRDVLLLTEQHCNNRPASF